AALEQRPLEAVTAARVRLGAGAGRRIERDRRVRAAAGRDRGEKDAVTRDPADRVGIEVRRALELPGANLRRQEHAAVGIGPARERAGEIEQRQGVVAEIVLSEVLD